MQGYLREERVSLDNLYLDPNNPRYADVSDTSRPVPDERVHEDGKQKKAKELILNERYDINQLKDSIRTIGFLPVDRLVVVELPQKDKYMVIEGNRRLAALKSLIEEEEDDLLDDIKASITEIPVLILENEDRHIRDHMARVLQGVRHVSSVKAWGPYQQAQIIVMMLDDDKPVSEIKETLGMTAQRINNLRRSYYSLRQMQNDPDYGPFAKPDMFSHFEEAYKVPKLRAWMQWDDDQNKYLNKDNRKMFYSWCVPYEEDDHKFDPKILDAKELRQIGTLLDNQVLFNQFCDSPTLRLPDALRGIPDNRQVDWRGILTNNISVLKQVPALSWATASDQDIILLKDVKDLCDQLIKLRSSPPN